MQLSRLARRSSRSNCIWSQVSVFLTSLRNAYDRYEDVKKVSSYENTLLSNEQNAVENILGPFIILPIIISTSCCEAADYLHECNCIHLYLLYFLEQRKKKKTTWRMALHISVWSFQMTYSFILRGFICVSLQSAPPPTLHASPPTSPLQLS